MFTSEKPKIYYAWSYQNVCDALTFLLDNIYIQFGTKLYRQVVGIPIGTYCAPLIADLFLFCYERYFMVPLSDDKQAYIIDTLNTISRYLDDILNINNAYFDNMVSQIYPSKLQLYKTNTSDTETAFLDLHLSISNDIFLPKFMINVTILILKLSFPISRWWCSSLYIPRSLYLSTHSFSHVADFYTCNKLLTQYFLKQCYRYHKLFKTFSKFYRQYFDLISKFHVGLKSFLPKGPLEPEFYGDLVYKLKKIVGSHNFQRSLLK